MNWLLTKTLGGDSGQNYVRWLKRIGIQGELVGPCNPWDVEQFDALLLVGGVDINPKLYNERPAPETQEINDERDTLELKMIRAFFDLKKPVFGVCRGIQILNVVQGGGLIQHIPSFLPAQEEHRSLGKKDSTHSLRFTRSSLLSDTLRGVTEVNSAHHQAVHPDVLGEGLRVIAVSGAGIIEAVEGIDLPSPVLAVQWHPERLPPDHPASANLLKLMLEMVG
jgi:putative glutamine amidotransferase